MNTLRILNSLIVLSVIVPSGFAQDGKPLHWYSVSFHQGTGVTVIYGTSPLDEAAFAKQLEGNSFVLIENLGYFNQNRQPKPWSEWSKFDEPHVYLNPKDIISFFPMRGDPRKLAPEKK
jgi:hypothetical protein